MVLADVVLAMATSPGTVLLVLLIPVRLLLVLAVLALDETLLISTRVFGEVC